MIGTGYMRILIDEAKVAAYEQKLRGGRRSTTDECGH